MTIHDVHDFLDSDLGLVMSEHDESAWEMMSE